MKNQNQIKHKEEMDYDNPDYSKEFIDKLWDLSENTTEKSYKWDDVREKILNNSK